MTRVLLIVLPFVLGGVYLLSVRAQREEPSGKTPLELCIFYESRGFYSKAGELCREHLMSHPDDPRAATVLGLIAVRGGNYDEAIRFYSTALRADPNHAKAWDGLVFAYTQNVRRTPSHTGVGISTIRRPPPEKYRGRYDRYREKANFLDLYGVPPEKDSLRW